jgi:histone-lysine N-methyltransferase SETMAR
MEGITEQLDVFENVITCDETSIFQYHPETKKQSMHWKTPSSLRMKKGRMSKTKVNGMMIVFFDIRGVIRIEWVPEGQTVNQKYYLEVLTKLRERVMKEKLELWKKKSWILHQDNAPAHNALAVKQFLANKYILVLKHPTPNSPDFTPRDFYLFPKLKGALQGSHFQSVDEVK